MQIPAHTTRSKKRSVRHSLMVGWFLRGGVLLPMSSRSFTTPAENGAPVVLAGRGFVRCNLALTSNSDAGGAAQFSAKTFRRNRGANTEIRSKLFGESKPEITGKNPSFRVAWLRQSKKTDTRKSWRRRIQIHATQRSSPLVNNPSVKVPQNRRYLPSKHEMLIRRGL